MNDNMRVVARAVVVQDGKVLLCWMIDGNHHFFPGGGVEFKESAVETLKREFCEELGVEMREATFIGIAENVFTVKGIEAHEINLVFSATIDEAPTESKEKHITFSWVAVNELERGNVLPMHLVKSVVKWLQDGKTFWIGLNSEES